MAGSGALNLSLLSRGIGEVSRNGHEKVEVVFEPEDYYSWANNPNRLYLPPLKQRQQSLYYNEKVGIGRGDNFHLHDEAPVHLPKTFTTRKGALLLFSEDLATKTRHRNVNERKRSHVTHSLNDLDLKTVDDFAKSILSYGKDEEDSGVYLGFIHPRRWYQETRRIRPGFSAKRYLSTWTQSWDDTLLHKLLDKGYMTDQSLQSVNSFIPHKRLRLYDDLSRCPAPYRLLRSMLLSPGSLSGYTFYRIRPESDLSVKLETKTETEDNIKRDDGFLSKPETGRNIKVVQSKQGVLKEVEYRELERERQEEVLTELLVKSAVHHALKKQQDIMDESYVTDRHENRLSVEGPIVSQEGRREKTPLPEFDMQEAVESLLDSQKGRSLLDGSILSGQSGVKTNSDHGGSLRGRSVPSHSARSFEAPRGRPFSDEVHRDGHFPRSFDTCSTGSNRPQPLPPIADEGGDISAFSVLPPIGDTEGRQDNLGPPEVNIEPPTPQHSTLTNLPQSRQATSTSYSKQHSVPPATESASQDETAEEWGSKLPESEILRREKEASMLQHQKEAQPKKSGSDRSGSPSPRSKGPVLAAGSHLYSSRESLETLSTASQVHLPGTLPGWKGSQPSLRSGGSHSKKGASSPRDNSPVKGSVVYGPDGAVINVGGAMILRESPVSLTEMNKLLDGAESVVSEDSGHLSDDEGGGVSFSSSAQPPSQLPQKRDSCLTLSSVDSRETMSQELNFDNLLEDSQQGEVNAQMSMHSWSYSAKEQDQRSRSQRSSLSNVSDDSSVVIDNPQVTNDIFNNDSGTESLNNIEPSSQSDQEISARSKSKDSVGEEQNFAQFKSDQTPRGSGAVSIMAADKIIEDTDLLKNVADENDELKLSLSEIDNGEDSTDSKNKTGSEFDKFSLTSRSDIPRLQASSSPVRMSSVIDQAVDQLFGPMTGSITDRSHASSDRISIAEQGLIDALTEHAQKIASSVLDQKDTGVNLSDDIKTAANLWMEQHPGSIISRSQSLQEVSNTNVAAEIARSQHRKSADPTVAEYKELIRRTLTSAVARQMGVEDGELPNDTEISQELMEALTNKSLTPDELEVVRTSSGRSIIRARSSETTPSPLKEGHLYQPANGKGTSHPSSSKSPKPPISIPNDRQNTADIGDLDVVNLGLAEQEAEPTETLSPADDKLSPAHSTRSGKSGRKLSAADQGLSPTAVTSLGSGKSDGASESKVSIKETKSPEQELADIMKELQVESPDKNSLDSRRKSKGSDKSKKSRPSLDSREEFLVGKVDDKKELEKLYAPLETPPKKETKIDGKPKTKKKSSAPVSGAKPGKKTKKKDKKKLDKDSASLSSQEVLSDKASGDVVVVISEKPKPPLEKDEAKEMPKESDISDAIVSGNDIEDNKSDYDMEQFSPSPSKSGSDIDFVFVREISSPGPDLPKSAKSAIPLPSTLDVTTDNEGDLSDSSSTQLNAISNKDARAAKRAAQAEKRRLEVEQKRKEREEQLKREKEEFERQERLNLEMEEVRRNKAEEKRLKKLRDEEEADQEEAMERDRLKRQQQEAEREKRMKEDYQRKFEEMKIKQAELEQQRLEDLLIRQREEEERRLEEERMLYEMAEHERIAYEKKKKEDAEIRKLEEEAARIRREEEAVRALEEARRLAEEMARKQAELEARLKFNRALMVEASGMEHTQDITRAFVYSYFELLQWLGLDIPEFDLQKLQAKF